MAVNNIRNRVAYGLSDALLAVAPSPIISKRAPTAADLAPLGQIWIDTVLQDAYILVAIISNAGVWINSGGGAGTFASLTVTPGPVSLVATGSGTVTIGNSANAFPVNINSGTGGVNINGNGNTIDIGVDAAANAVFVGSTTNGAVTTIQGGNGTGIGTAAVLITSAAAGDIFIGGSAHTGIISMGNSTAASGETVNIANSLTGGNTAVNILSGVGTAGANTLALGNNTRVTTIGLGNIAPAAARTTTIAGGNSAQNDTVSVLNGAPSAGTQTYNVMSGTATGGTQAVNIGNGIGGSLTVSIGNGVNSTAQVVNIANGAAAANSTVNILSGNASAGTQTLNLAIGTGGKTVHIADGAGINAVTLGSSTTSSTTTIKAGTGGLLLSGGQVVPAIVTAGTANVYVLLATDQFVGTDTTAGVLSITLPAAPATGRFITVYDATGQAAANTVTINGNGKNISSAGASAATATLTTAYASMNLWYNGTIWNAQKIA